MLQNHGLVVAGSGASEVNRLHAEVARVIRKALSRLPDLSPADADEAARADWEVAIGLAFSHDAAIRFHTDVELLQRLESPERFAPLAGAFSPDHIVYAGSEPVYVTATPLSPSAALASLITRYRNDHGSDPRIIAVEGLGVFAVAESPSACETALALFLDEVKIAAYADSFGGPRHLDPHLVRFIESWEVERYRKQISEGGKS